MAAEKLSSAHRQGTEGSTPVPEASGIEYEQGLCDRKIRPLVVRAQMKLQGGVGVAEYQHVGVQPYRAGDGSAKPSLDPLRMSVHE